MDGERKEGFEGQPEEEKKEGFEQQPEGEKTEEKSREQLAQEGKQIAWLSYLGILVIVPILVDPHNEYIKFHVRQGIAILLLELGWIILDLILEFIPIIKYLAGILNFFIWLGFLAISIVGLINALQGEWKKLPVIGEVVDALKII